jgi:N4-gp56 family major capsid protein
MNAMPYEDGNYRAVVHPAVSDAIRSDSTYPTWNAFGNRGSALDKGRLGVIERVYFEESSQAMKTDFPASDWSALYVRAGGSILGTLIHGKGAYGVSKLGGKDAKVTVVTGEDKADPLNQLTKIGYKFQMGAVVLNPSCGVILPWFTSGVTY